MITYLEAIQKAIIESMKKNRNIFLIGEDLKHSTFGVTDKIYELFPDRVFSTPISENAIIGAAIGAAMNGCVPLVEIMFADFLGVCMDGVLNQMPKLRALRPDIPMHVVIRAPTGAGLSLGCQHSQAVEVIFTHIHGIKILVPGDPSDAYFLLKYALENEGIYMFFEHKNFYYDTGNLEILPDFGKARFLNRGDTITFATYQYGTKTAIKVIEKLGIKADLIDLRTLAPLDVESIVESVKKTGRLVVIEEGYNGIGAFIIAQVVLRGVNFSKPPLWIKNEDGFISYKNDFRFDVDKIVKELEGY